MIRQKNIRHILIDKHETCKVKFKLCNLLLFNHCIIKFSVPQLTYEMEINIPIL